MAKDKSASKDPAQKKEKKEKKRSEEDGVHKKKESKKDKRQKTEVLTTKVHNAIENPESGAVPVDEEMTIEKVEKPRLVGALVPFANPLADEKIAKKVFKGVKKAAASKTLKRGVKEVVKSLRKSTDSTPVSSKQSPSSVVVLAADISPMDVISHIPVLCEDHGIPYIYVTSRAELGAAGMTKRPTSVVMIQQKSGKKGGEQTTEGDWDETFSGLVKVVEKEGTRVKI